MPKNHAIIFVLLVTVFTITGFDSIAFAEEIVIQKPLLKTDDISFGSMIKIQTVSDDGSVWIFLTATEPAEKEQMTINMKFTDKDGKRINDINYDVIATQNGQIVLEDLMVSQQIGIGDHRTQTLLSDDSVSVRITLQGIGTDPPFEGPHGESVQMEEVPEFGTIAMLILTVAIIGIIGISAKSRLTVIR